MDMVICSVCGTEYNRRRERCPACRDPWCHMDKGQAKELVESGDAIPQAVRDFAEGKPAPATSRAHK
jgi:predicted ATP-dependent serine protease